MDFDEIFTAYYTQYRTEAEIPASSDDEYKIALPLANEAINRWSRYDATYWKELYSTLSVAEDGDKVIAQNKVDYATPSDMREAGGFVHVYNDQGVTQVRIPIIEPQDAQFRNDNSTYCYFTGSPGLGFTLHLNPAPSAAIVGMTMQYVYYKKPTTFTTGSDISEMNDPYFMVHRMLANRFRGSRNPFYTSAKADAEDCLKTMQADNNSGNWADPWKLADNSSGRFGI